MAEEMGGIKIPITADASDLENTLGRAGGKIEEFGKSISSVMKGLSTETGQALLAMKGLEIGFELAAEAFHKIIESGAELGRELNEIADMTGLAAGEINTLTMAAHSVGLESNGMAQMLNVASKNIGELSLGSEEAEKKFAKFGITMKDLEGLSPAEQFNKVAIAIGNIGDHATQMAAAFELMGRGGGKAIELFKAMAEGAVQFGSESEKATTKAAEELKKYDIEVTKLWDSIKTTVLKATGAVAEEINNLSKIQHQTHSEKRAQWEEEKAMGEDGVQRYKAAMMARQMIDAHNAEVKKEIAEKESEQKIRETQEQFALSKVYEEAAKKQDEILTKKIEQAALDNKKAHDEGPGEDPVLEKYQREMAAAEELEGQLTEMGRSDEGREAKKLAQDTANIEFIAARTKEGLKADEAQKIQAGKDDETHAKETHDLIEAKIKDITELQNKQKSYYDEVFQLEEQWSLQYMKTEEDIERIKSHAQDYDQAQMKLLELSHEKFLASKLTREKEYALNLEEETTRNNETIKHIGDNKEKQYDLDLSKHRLQRAQKDQQDGEHSRILMAGDYNDKLTLASEFFSDMSAMTSSKNREMFEIGKAASIANTIISTFQGAQAAFTAFAGSGAATANPGMVALGVAAAAAAVVAGLARVQAIESTSMGSSGSSGGGGGGIGSIPTSTSQTNQSNVNVTLYGDSFSAKQVQGLVGLINSKAIDNNMRLTTQVSSGYAS